MRIRNKLILAMAVPVGLLILQIILVNLSIRELQFAVEFIASATTVIEDDFVAIEEIDALREEIKQVPAGFVSSRDGDGGARQDIERQWAGLNDRLDGITASDAYLSAGDDTRSAIDTARQDVSVRLSDTLAVLDDANADLDTLLETAIFAERGLVGLRDGLSDLAVELRQQLQEAVAYEREIHNRPVIAGIVVGGLVVLVIIGFAWIYVDGHLVKRLTGLSSSMIAIAGGNLKADIPPSNTHDEIGEMADALKVFRETAVEVEEKNLRDIADAWEQVSEKNAMLENLSVKLSKYLSPQVYSSIFRGEQEVALASRRKKLTIMFSDIAGFTETTDLLESEELTSLLNNYLTEMSKIALEHGATIDKYIGDAIMLFFGDPESRGVEQDALACVQTAMAMQRRMTELQAQWRDRGLENPFRLRIGINTGYCTVGNFGSETRMDYTIVGSAVNIAERLESSADVGSILIAHETYSLVKSEIDAEELEPKSLKGFAKPVRCYQVVGSQRDGDDVKFDLGGVEIRLDRQSLSGEERQRSVATLKAILSQLEK